MLISTLKREGFVGDEGWEKPHDKQLAGACSWGATVCEAGTSETFHSGMRGETSPMYLRGMTTLTPRTLRLSWGFTYRPSPMVCGADTPNGFISSGRMHYYIKDYQGNVRQVTDADGVVEQDNHYYPYGMLMGESSNILASARGYKSVSFNPYLYGSKEYLTLASANLLDFTARTYDPAAILFHTQDPKATDYTHLNSYLYCGGEPVNRIDPDGRDIAVLLVEEGFTHLALLISTEEGKWLYYSVNGNNIYVSGSFSGGKHFNEVGIDGGWSSPQDFLDSEFNTKPKEGGENDPNYANYNYTEAYEIKTTPEQDKKIAESFTKIAQEEYGLTSNNCAHAVQRSLEAGGVKVSEEVSSTFMQASLSAGTSTYITFTPRQPKSIMPKNALNSIIKQNPNGQLYRKSN